MSLILCLGQAKRKRAPKGRIRKSTGATEQDRVFTIVERVPIRLEANKAIWDALKKHAARQLIIDDARADESMPADVMPVDKLSNAALADVEAALRERRSGAMERQAKLQTGRGMLARELDATFEEQKEWIAIRGLLAGAMSTKASKKKNRSLLLLRA